MKLVQFLSLLSLFGAIGFVTSAPVEESQSVCCYPYAKNDGLVSFNVSLYRSFLTFLYSFALMVQRQTVHTVVKDVSYSHILYQ